MDEIVIDALWLGDFVRARDPGEATELQTAVRAGELVRLVRGVYVRSSVWDEADARERHVILARAVVVMRERRLVLSHRTAAIAWGLPLLGAPPVDVHVVAPRDSGGRSDDRLVRHCLDIPSQTVMLDGLEATTLARTAIDVARTSPIAEGIVVADAVRARGVTSAELSSELPEPGSRGVKRAREVVAFSNGLSGSPFESLSRWSIARAGLTAPELQHEFVDAEGRMFVDFWWPRFGVIGEFDGLVKYTDEGMRAGRSAAEVVIAEKRREDRLRRQPGVHGFVRWGAEIAASPARLAGLLRAAGVR